MRMAKLLARLMIAAGLSLAGPGAEALMTDRIAHWHVFSIPSGSKMPSLLTGDTERWLRVSRRRTLR